MNLIILPSVSLYFVFVRYAFTQLNCTELQLFQHPNKKQLRLQDVIFARFIKTKILTFLF